MEYGLISFLPLQIERLLGPEGMSLEDVLEHRRLLILNGLMYVLSIYPTVRPFQLL